MSQEMNKISFAITFELLREQEGGRSTPIGSDASFSITFESNPVEYFGLIKFEEDCLFPGDQTQGILIFDQLAEFLEIGSGTGFDIFQLQKKIGKGTVKRVINNN